MGRLEEKSRKRQKRKNLQQAILQTVVAAGLLSAALLAPNIIGAMDKLGLIPNRF